MRSFSRVGDHSGGGLFLLFNSYVFILLFLPLCLTGYFGLNHFKKYNLAQAFLLIMSLWFYGYFHMGYLVIILSSVVINFGFSRLMYKAGETKWRKALLLLALTFNLGLLFYYKYFDFLIVNCNLLLKTDFALRHILLPLGISFFTFQQISYVVDAYHGEVQQYNFLQYATFVAYFPQLIAGPIVTHDELIPQFMDENKKKFNWDNFCRGLYILSLGLAKKVLIADTFGNAVNYGFSNVTVLDTTNAFLTALAYSIQIYFDFSGYCDMAIGLGKMMNLNLPINFDSPYKSLTITEFWDRWHKTLTRFFTRYVYIPLGGSRHGQWKTYRNVLLVFFASGLWHGANYTFILWGVMHGVFNVITRHWKSWFERIHPALNWLITFSFVTVTWVFFRADTISDAVEILKRILWMEFGPVDSALMDAFLLPELQFIINNVSALSVLQRQPEMLLTAFYGGALILILGPKNAHEQMHAFRPTLLHLLFAGTLLMLCILSFSGVSTFLYFNF